MNEIEVRSRSDGCFIATSNTLQSELYFVLIITLPAPLLTVSSTLLAAFS